MKKIAYAAFSAVAALALSACGSSDSAKEEAAPDNVEMPAEEAMGNVDAAAVPAVDASASGAAAAAATAAPADAVKAAEDATAAAEKKM